MSVSAIIPSRGRPDSCAKAVASLKGAHTVVVIDRDQEDAYKAADIWATECLVYDRLPTLPMYFNLAAEQIDADFYMAAGDDMQMLTPDWVDVIESLMDPTKPQLGWIPDRSDGHPSGLAAYPVLTRAWVEATERMFPPHFPYWFTDRWLTECADVLGLKVKLPLEYRDIGKRGRTNRMRDLCFWSRVYALTWRQRVGDCLRLSAAAGLPFNPSDFPKTNSMTPEHAMLLELDWAQWPEKDRQYADVVRNALHLVKSACA